MERKIFFDTGYFWKLSFIVPSDLQSELCTYQNPNRIDNEISLIISTFWFDIKNRWVQVYGTVFTMDVGYWGEVLFKQNNFALSLLLIISNLSVSMLFHFICFKFRWRFSDFLIVVGLSLFTKKILLLW